MLVPLKGSRCGAGGSATGLSATDAYVQISAGDELSVRHKPPGVQQIIGAICRPALQAASMSRSAALVIERNAMKQVSYYSAAGTILGASRISAVGSTSLPGALGIPMRFFDPAWNDAGRAELDAQGQLSFPPPVTGTAP